MCNVFAFNPEAIQGSERQTFSDCIIQGKRGDTIKGTFATVFAVAANPLHVCIPVFVFDVLILSTITNTVQLIVSILILELIDSA